MIAFLSPVSKIVLAHREILPPGTLGKQIKVHANKGEFPSFDGAKFALLGLKEDRADVDYMGAERSFDLYRKAFYSLYPGNWSHDIIDLGELENGETPEDSRFATKETIEALLKMDIIPIILGAGQDLVYGQYRAYDNYGSMVNMVNIDSRFDLGNADLPISNNSYVGKIVVD